MDQWLALLILGDLDPYTPPITPRVSLPTRSTKSRFPPMRYLTEIRLTEFTRLIDETDWTVARAAGAVGWRDPRVASRWFSRRYGITPSQYRASGRPEGRQANPPHSPAG